VQGWGGPYIYLWSTTTPWKGHLNFYNGVHGPIISFDDDAPISQSENNIGPVPAPSMLEIDQRIDDGNLSTGKMRIGLSPECDAVGEFCVLITN
jgi:hypothetical protein